MSAPTAVKAPAKVTPPPVKPAKVTMEVGTLRVVRVGADDVWSIEREFTDDSRQVLHQGIEGQAKALRRIRVTSSRSIASRPRPEITASAGPASRKPASEASRGSSTASPSTSNSFAKRRMRRLRKRQRRSASVVRGQQSL